MIQSHETDEIVSWQLSPSINIRSIIVIELLRSLLLNSFEGDFPNPLDQSTNITNKEDIYTNE